jgi:hypothetical protein
LPGIGGGEVGEGEGEDRKGLRKGYSAESTRMIRQRRLVRRRTMMVCGGRLFPKIKV